MTVLVNDRNYHFGKSWFTILFFDLIRIWVARGNAGRACDMSTTTALA